MKVAISCDRNGRELKDAIKASLTALGHEVTDVGAQSADDPVTYFESAAALSRMIQAGTAERGIAICATGAGSTLICSAYKGVHSVCCESVYTAEKIGLSNNANVLALGWKTVSKTVGCEMAAKYLAGSWCDGFDEAAKANAARGYAALCRIEETGDL